jgi:hypothetical protein
LNCLIRVLAVALFVASGAAHAVPVTVTWVNATTTVNCTPLPAWNSGQPGRLYGTWIQQGRRSGTTFTMVSEVRVLMPATTVTFEATVGSDFAVRAQHVTVEGVRGPASPAFGPGETIVVTPPCAPVDCVVSAWTLGTPTPAICPSTGVQSRVDTRTILTAPTNGGAICPALTRTTSVTCTVTQPTGPVVVPVVAGLNMSPAFRVNANGSRDGWIVAFVPVGVPCTGPVLFTYRSRSYRAFDWARATWWASSPQRAAVACQ